MTYNSDMERAERKFTNQMKKVGIEVISFPNIWLQCMECGQKFSTEVQPGGKLHRGYWKCPKGCNEDKRLH